MSDTEPQDAPVLRAEQLGPELERHVLRKVRRALARLQTLMGVNVNVFAEVLAKDSPHHADRLLRMSIYLELACERMCRIALARRCAECGCPMGFEIGPEGLGFKRTPRADARYCSPACRQKAHRKRRVTDSTSPTAIEPSHGNGSHRADNSAGVTEEGGAA
jgi:hypothetical protein